MSKIEKDSQVVLQLPPELCRIRFAESDIPNELAHVAFLRAHQMPEGMAFYAGRILEATAHEVVKRLGLNPSDKAFVNVDLIGATGQIADGYLACGHALRRIANDARHLLRPIGTDEQDTVIALLQIWLEWLTHFVRGDTADATPSAMPVEWSEAVMMIRALVDGSLTKLNEWVHPQGDADNRLLAESTTAAFLCERLTDARHPAAENLIARCLQRFGSQKRFRQLRALHLSRNGRAAEAIEHLRPVLRWKYGDNSETLGILGGACKNLWLKDRDLTHLQNARSYYARTPGEGRSNYYLLVNAAATSLWLRDEAGARTFAHQALQDLGNFGLTDQWARSPLANFWMVATLAEVHLIMGNTKLAKDLYDRARSLDHTNGRWTRTQEQLRIHLEFLPNAQQVMQSMISVDD